PGRGGAAGRDRGAAGPGRARSAVAMAARDPEGRAPAGALIGVVDGSLPANTRRFHVVLDDSAAPQLDDLVVTTQTLPDGRQLSHYGIVVESTGMIEGAEMPSDTLRIASARTMPGVTARRVEVQILRA